MKSSPFLTGLDGVILSSGSLTENFAFAEPLDTFRLKIPTRDPPLEVERENRMVVEMAKSMLQAQSLGLDLWPESVVNAAYTSNRCSKSAVANRPAEQAWNERQLRVDHMRNFMCIVYGKVPDCQRTIFEAKTTNCLFLGYCEGTKAYRLMSLETKKIIRSLDVSFCED